MENSNTAIKKITAERLQDIAISIGTRRIRTRSGNHEKTFVIDKWNKEIIWLLSLYFTNDERFKTFGFDLNKGIFLYGGVGVGKTLIMQMFMENPKHSYILKPCAYIATQYAQHGHNGIQPYYTRPRNIVSSDHFGHRDIMGICFDDLGTEENEKFYGTEKNCMAMILNERYVRLNPFSNTHITTNLTADGITINNVLTEPGLQQHYGSRVRSRCAEMFNLIQFDKDAPDRRKM